MNALKFRLSGEVGFFKNPMVNSYKFFTFEHIHKIALLGVLGAITGLGGHGKRNLEKNLAYDNNDKDSAKNVKLEFYEKLKNLKVSIVPISKNGVFTKSDHYYTNTTGHASGEAGGVLMIREQVLLNPAWDIYILDDDSIEREVFEKIRFNMEKNIHEYSIYLGRTENFAYVDNVEYVSLSTLKHGRISSLFLADAVELGFDSSDERSPFAMEALLPDIYTDEVGYGPLSRYWFSNLIVEGILSHHEMFYSHNERNLYFM